MIIIRRLIWDNWNVAHIARHDVIPDEVEEVCYGQPVVSTTYKSRFRVVGQTKKNRTLTVILTPKEEPCAYYVVTARSADRKERANYKSQLKKNV